MKDAYNRLLFKLQSLAFCCLSTCTFGFHSKKAEEIILNTVRPWLELNNLFVMQIIFDTFENRGFNILGFRVHYILFRVKTMSDCSFIE